MNITQRDINLTQEEFEKNVNEIFAELSLYAVKSDDPTFVLVGGQAGSGKSVLVAKENMLLQGNAIIIDQDELRTKYPKEKYTLIHDNCTEREEFLLLKSYMSKLIVAIEQKAKKYGYNIIWETALRSVKTFISTIEDLKNSGYNTKLSILTVPEIEGNISMLTRYCYYLEKYGECRRNTRIDPESVKSIRKNIKLFDDLELFNDITVSIRGKNKDSLPIQIYSQQKNPNVTPVEAYDIGEIQAYDDTKNSFFDKYNEIKSILIKHNDTEQLKKLESIRSAFEMINYER